MVRGVSLSMSTLTTFRQRLTHVLVIILHMLQVLMPDAEYREQANELAIALSEPHVKGVFEERLPLELHAALHLGCVTAVTPDSRSKSMQDGFELADLQVLLHAVCTPAQTRITSQIKACQ